MPKNGADISGSAETFQLALQKISFFSFKSTRLNKAAAINQLLKLNSNLDNPSSSLGEALISELKKDSSKLKEYFDIFINTELVIKQINNNSTLFKNLRQERQKFMTFLFDHAQYHESVVELAKDNADIKKLFNRFPNNPPLNLWGFNRKGYNRYVACASINAEIDFPIDKDSTIQRVSSSYSLFFSDQLKNKIIDKLKLNQLETNSTSITKINSALSRVKVLENDCLNNKVECKIGTEGYKRLSSNFQQKFKEIHARPFAISNVFQKGRAAWVDIFYKLLALKPLNEIKDNEIEKIARVKQWEEKYSIFKSKNNTPDSALTSSGGVLLEEFQSPTIP